MGAMLSVRASAVLAGAVLVGLVAPALAAAATSSAEFSSDFRSVTISSSQDISNYQVTLCSGVQTRVESKKNKDSIGKTLTLTFAEPILEVEIKSGTTVRTFIGASGSACGGTPPPPPTPASVSSVSAGCAGDTITATAEATGSNGQTFSLALHADGSPTGQSETVTLDGSGSYQVEFDVSALEASVYSVVASTGAGSGDVAAATCAPGAEIPEAPLALLLPLSMLGLLGLAGAMFRRRRGGQAAPVL